MALPFKPSTWIRRADLPAGFGTPSNLYIDPTSGYVFLPYSATVGVNTTFEGHFPIDINLGAGVLSTDQAGSWITDYDSVTGTNAPDLARPVHYFSILGANGRPIYYRIRDLFYTSFIFTNPTIFPGYTVLESSDDARFWSFRQSLFSWPHIPDGGAGSRAGHSISLIGPIRMPGTGPAGETADWLLVHCAVGSSAVSVINDNAWWRSIDRGQTWTRVRTESSVVDPTFIVRSATGRLIAGDIGPRYSDDNGVTWNIPGGLLPAQPRSGITSHLGNTWAIYMIGGIGSPADAGVSCDDGTTWSSAISLGPTNTGGLAIQVSPSEALFVVRTVDGAPSPMRLWYSNNGGESFYDLGTTDLWGTNHTGQFGGLLPDGRPLVVDTSRVSAVCTERAPGAFSARTICPLAFAGLQKSGIPSLCGHPITQTPCG